MSAKIKTHRQSHRQYRPKGINLRHFERVYWPYLPLLVVIGGIMLYGLEHGNFQYIVEHGVRNSQSSSADPQLAFVPLTSKLAMVSIWSVLIAAIGTLVGKHYRQIRRSLIKGEKYFFHHPLVDVCLILIAGLSYLLAQTSSYNF